MNSARWITKDAFYAACAVVGRSPRPLRAILMYHEVGGPAGPSQTVFRRQMDWLASRSRVVPVRDLPGHLSLSEPVTSVTFDDGYAETIAQVEPVLRSVGIAATFFLPSGMLGQSFQTSDGARLLIDPADAKELASSGHEIGAHTVTHRPLTSLPRDEAEREIAGSKDELESMLAQSVSSFAYPKGAFDPELQRMVIDSGFRLAVSVREALLEGELDPTALPRVLVGRGVGMTQFKAKLSGGLDVYERLRGRR